VPNEIVVEAMIKGLRPGLKGKCALGPFLSILVVKCQHKWFKYETMQMVEEVQINTKV
jgi:hypothetical protein